MNDDMTRGWEAIERYAGRSRKTLLARGYPIHKEVGVIWALKSEIDRHRRRISTDKGAWRDDEESVSR